MLVCFYRISDCSQTNAAGGSFNKQRPEWFDKRRCFLNFLSVFGPTHLFVIADCVSDDTRKWLESKVSPSQISYTKHRSGAFSFLHAARMAASLPDNTKVYFSEDDYLHAEDCKQCLVEALDISDYATGYDAGDKYINAGTVGEDGCVGNPLITGDSEVTRLYLTKFCHWKETNSTTMTFSAKAGMIKKDYPIYEKYCSSGYPRDFNMWLEILSIPNRKLISAVPAKATHCETAYLAPILDWQAIAMISPNDDV